MSGQTGGFPNDELDAALRDRGITPSPHARQMLATKMLQAGIDPSLPPEPTPSEPPPAVEPKVDHGMRATYVTVDELAGEDASASAPTSGGVSASPAPAASLDLPPPMPYADDEETPPEPPPPPPGVMHPEVEAIWGGGKLDGLGVPAIRTAETLIEAWGLERFLNSELHRQAKYEATRAARMAPIQKAFVEAQKKKESEKGRKR